MTNQRSTLLMFAAMAAMLSETNPRTPMSKFEPTKPEPKKKPITKYGNGKKCYVFTNHNNTGTVEIYADNVKSALKKLKYVYAYNRNIK